MVDRNLENLPLELCKRFLGVHLFYVYIYYIMDTSFMGTCILW